MLWDDTYRKDAAEYEIYLRMHHKEKNDYEKLLSNLEREWSEKSVKEENYISLKKEYTAKLQETKKYISKLKFQITALIKKCNKDIDKIDSQIEQIKLRHKVGEYSEEKLKELLSPSETERRQFESLIIELKRIHGLKYIPKPTTDDVVSETEPSQPRRSPIPTSSTSISTAEEQAPEISAPMSFEEPPPILVPAVFKKSSPVRVKKSLWIMASITMFVILILCFVIWNIEVHKKVIPQIGDQAPNFSLPDMNGKTVNLQDFHGKGVVLYLWDTSCPYCKNDLSWINELNGCTYDEAIIFLTINISDSRGTAIKYFEENGYSIPVLNDMRGTVIKQYVKYTLGHTYPDTILIGSNGQIRNVKVGPFQSKTELKTFIESGLTPRWDNTPPQIYDINLSKASILSWKTDEETHSNIQGFRNSVGGAGVTLGENWTRYHSVNETVCTNGYYDQIQINSYDRCGNSASKVFTLPNCINLGCRAPDFTATSTNNQDITLSAVPSKMTLLHFWLLGCGACEKELPLIQKLYYERPREELEILAVNVRGDIYSINDFVTANGYRLIILLDTEGIIDAAYHNPRFPTTFLLDCNKVIINKHDGAFQNYEEIVDFVGQYPKLPGK
ncbi:MAG: redoxin domain-containing protein [Dehalococcoidia bacterium]|jgi:peroxiredoxin